MSDKRIPTAGRIVHFYDTLLRPHANNHVGAGPYAAIVTQAGESFVNLRVLSPLGDDWIEMSVEEKPENAGPSDDRYWSWPPRA